MARKQKTNDDKIASTFAQTLQKLMDARNVKQQPLADSIGVTRQTVSQYCRGSSEPGFEFLIKIANYFDVSIDYLITGKGDDRKRPSAVEDLGISQKVVEWLEGNKTDRKAGLCPDFDRILEDESFDSLIDGIQKYLAAARAEEIYRQILAKYIDPTLEYDKVYDIVERSDWDVNGFRRAVNNFANSVQCPAIVRTELLTLIQLFEVQTSTTKFLSLYFNDSELTDLRSYQASKQLDLLLKKLNIAVKEEIRTSPNMD